MDGHIGRVLVETRRVDTNKAVDQFVRDFFFFEAPRVSTKWGCKCREGVVGVALVVCVEMHRG